MKLPPKKKPKKKAPKVKLPPRVRPDGKVIPRTEEKK